MPNIFLKTALDSPMTEKQTKEACRRFCRLHCLQMNTVIPSDFRSRHLLFKTLSFRYSFLLLGLQDIVLHIKNISISRANLFPFIYPWRIKFRKLLIFAT